MKQKKIIDTYRPSTNDIYTCLQEYPKWVKFLLGNGKPYESFLSKLIEVRFFKDEEGKTTIKRLAEAFSYKRELITKWLAEIYEDIFELNFDRPEFFKEEGVKHELYLKSYHASASLTVWLKSTPRLNEHLDIYFVKAKLGTDNFWVKDVRHSIDNSEHSITVWLHNGFCNKYRELLVGRAQYFGHLGFMDIYQKKDFEVDKQLRAIYKY